MNQNIIEAHNLCRQFGDYWANNNVSLNVPTGSIYGILGPNGAGKTTFIRMLTTISNPDSGSILFRGKPLQLDDARFMGYMPEERGLYKKMKVLEQLLFFAEIKGVKRNIAKEKAKIWMDKLQITSWANKKIEELSKGMAQKVQFVSTVLHEPALIILDEPFSGFDPQNADLIKEEIIQLKNNGSTILFSTHRMDNVEELCDYLCIIHKGEKVLDGAAGELRRNAYKGGMDVGYLHSIELTSLNFEIQLKEQTPDGRFIYHIPKNEKNNNDIFTACAQKGNVVYFAESLPSMHEIFVNTVTEEKENA